MPKSCSLAATPGVTVLIHDQALCGGDTTGQKAAAPSPTPRLRGSSSIDRICEGCGDCGDVSRTACRYSRSHTAATAARRRIDQASCNLRSSPVSQGDCPAFMTVEVDPNAKGMRTAARFVHAGARSGPAPRSTIRRRTIGHVHRHAALAGIGGTGVVTVSSGDRNGGDDARRLHHAHGLDQTGLSQKAGPVISDITIVTGDRVQDRVAPRDREAGVELQRCQVSSRVDGLEPQPSIEVVGARQDRRGGFGRTSIAGPARSLPSRVRQRPIRTTDHEPRPGVTPPRT